jgi:hypothetical protein
MSAIAHCILVSRANDSRCSVIVNFRPTDSVLIISFPKDIADITLNLLHSGPVFVIIEYYNSVGVRGKFSEIN